MLDLVNSLGGDKKINRRTMLSVGSICLGGLSLHQSFCNFKLVDTQPKIFLNPTLPTLIQLLLHESAFT